MKKLGFLLAFSALLGFGLSAQTAPAPKAKPTPRPAVKTAPQAAPAAAEQTSPAKNTVPKNGGKRRKAAVKAVPAKNVPAAKTTQIQKSN